MHAFPADIARANADVMNLLAASATVQSQSPIEVTYNAKTLRFPSRVYYASDLVDAAIIESGDGAIVAACLGSRHKDGYLRQRCIEVLLGNPRPWAAPYLVEALDERPVQILHAIAGGIPDDLLPDIGAFVIANEARFLWLCRRCVSLWNEFYRYPGGGAHVTWLQYPGARVISDMLAAARSISPHFGEKNRGAIPNGRVVPFQPVS
jgi:hypothetical protein